MKSNPYLLIKNNRKKECKLSISSVFQLLERNSKKFGQKDAIVFVDPVKNSKLIMSHAELFELVQKTIYFLRNKLELKQGDSIALLMNNIPDLLVLNLAAWSCGLIVSPLSTKTDSVKTKIYKINHIKSKCLFVDLAGVCNAKKQIPKIRKSVKRLAVIDISDKSLSELTKNYFGKSVAKYLVKDLTKTGLVLFTSGTTAQPKGVVLTPHSLLANADSIVEWLNISKDERFHLVLPLSHINSIVFSLATFLAGGTAILSSKYSASKFWQIAKVTKATCSSIVPTIVHDLINDKKTNTKLVRYLPIKRIQVGSAPVRPDDCHKFYKKFGIRLIQGYGQTETSLRSTGVPFDVNEKVFLNLLEMNTIGTELKYTNVTVLKKDGIEAKEEGEGEICVRGPIIMKLYLKNKKETDRSFKFGWFHSGDWGYFKIIDGRKYYFIKGRIKELIIKGGINISPMAVERALLAKYKTLLDVYAFPYFDKRYGGIVAAAVTLKNGKHKVNQRNFVNKIIKDGKNGLINGISDYQSPSRIFVAKDGFPKTGTGKIQRVKLREKFSSV